MNSQHSTKDSNEIQLPIQALKFILNKLKINDLFKKYIKDPRCQSDYSLHSLLMFCLSTHIFRLPSKNKFHQHLKRTFSAKAIAKFCGFGVERSPCPRTTDDLLLRLNSEDFLPILPEIFRGLCRHKGISASSRIYSFQRICYHN